jgi:putative nucleotidyltransferase with HDIG domain
MPDESANTRIALQTELAVGRLDSLSTLPCIGAKFLPKLLEEDFSPSSLADIIESDPALAARILSIVEGRGASFPRGRFSLRQALDKLSAHEVRDAILSVKVAQGFDADDGIDTDRAAARKGLLLHSIAVACCARAIAETARPQMDCELAYLAGLLHDIGKLALEETMPKSFSTMVEEARATKSSLCAIEKKHLGTDHTIIGKRLAQQWRLPQLIVLAIWLHHSRTIKIAEDMPEVRLAAVVQLADSIARQSDIGGSGSFDSPESVEVVSQLLAISPEQLEQISESLPETIRQKSNTLGLYLPNSGANYCRIVHSAAAQLARRDTRLSGENHRLQSDSNHLGFVTEFLAGINSTGSAIDIAENLAVRWQKFYQTGMVCLYLVPPAGMQTVEAVVVDELAQSRTACLNAPVDASIVPKRIANSFAILDAYDYIEWLLEQLEAEFDEHRTKLLPLLSGGEAIGAVVFELFYPEDAELFEEKYRMCVSVAGAVLGMALEQERQQYFSEVFARLISGPADAASRAVSPDNSLAYLAELSAGAAHELNNPLAVISGRAQLLAGTEDDQEKKRILEQIYENSKEASAIIADLMGFAEPSEPRASRTDVRQILDEAVELAKQKTRAGHLDISIETAGDVGDVFVDSGQIASAVANVICNAAESYGEKAGPIEITAETAEHGDSVEIQITDTGCGMDSETVKKAAQPFFSAKAAGRKRGMGLAYAVRFVELNNGSLNITSKPDQGTRVTVRLPCRRRANAVE